MNKDNVVRTHTATTELHIPSYTDSTSRNLKAFRANKSLSVILKILRSLCAISPALAVRFSTFLFLHPRRKTLNYVLLPEGYQKIQIVHNLKKLVAYQWGHGERTIILVHGWESHLGHMIPLIQPLVNAGYKVIAFDGPAHGHSPQLMTNMIDFGNAVMAAIEQQDPVYAVIANSFGAAATSLMLEREPHIKLEKLVMLSPMNHIRQHIDIFEKILGYPANMHARIIEHINKSLPLPIERCDVTEAVKNISTPALIVHDLDDAVIPAKGTLDIAVNYEGSILKNTEGLGHRGVVRHATVHKWILDFLAQDDALN